MGNIILCFNSKEITDCFKKHKNDYNVTEMGQISYLC